VSRQVVACAPQVRQAQVTRLATLASCQAEGLACWSTPGQRSKVVLVVIACSILDIEIGPPGKRGRCSSVPRPRIKVALVHQLLGLSNPKCYSMLTHAHQVATPANSEASGGVVPPSAERLLARTWSTDTAPCGCAGRRTSNIQNIDTRSSREP